MFLLSLFAIALLFIIVGLLWEIGLPDPFLLALFGIAILSIANFFKRRLSWR